MRVQVIRFLFISLLTVCCATLNAQTIVTGTVVDAESSEPVIGAAVIQSGTSNGVVTGVDGTFTFEASSASGILIFKSLGYNDVQKSYSGLNQINLGQIEMSVNSIALADVTITSSMAIARKTPIAVSTLEPQFIEERIGMRDFPELMRTTPSIYVVKGGGGFGDTEIMMRGFKKENIAIMVNGVPMNDMENGTVYWSNWTSLADVTRNKQIQRGIGASKVSAPSVGGSINIVTSAVEARKGGSVSYEVGQDGYNKLLFTSSTGLSDKGWAMTLMGGKEWGDGYIMGTEYESYSYFINIAKRFNDNHQLSLTAFGSPQWHNQRNSYDGLTIQGWQEVKNYTKAGQQYRYNPTYGFDSNGQRRAANKNKYHKPQISLNHMWQIDNTSSLSTAAYVSIGEGWGTRGEGNNGYGNGDWFGSSNGQLSTKFRNPDGTFAYNQIEELNANSDNGSKMVMTVSKNGHRWYGLISTYTKELSENLSILGGIDGRYYKGIHTNEIYDLYGGDYYVDAYRASIKADNNSAVNNSTFKNEKLTVGDIVRRNFDGNVLQGGAFGQAEYSTEQLSAFVSASLSYTSQWRYDRFYYEKSKAESEKVGKLGFTAKGGANYNFNEYHNVFGNVGIISRAPYLDGGIFLNVTNSNLVNPDAVNEKVYSFEVGYGFQNSWIKADLNAYHTMWNDKTMTNYQDITTNGSVDRAVINMQGVNAIHQGIELEATVKPFTWLDVKGMFSIGDWRWSDNPSGYWYNSSGQPLKNSAGEIASGVGAADHAKSTLELDGIKVGQAAQTTAFVGVNVKPTKDIRVSLDWNYAARIYADYDLRGSSLGMGNKVSLSKPWQIPSASTFDLSASYSFKIGTFNSTLSGIVTNLLDQEYIQSARDGSDHTWKTADRVYYGFGRQMSVKLKVNF